MALFHFSVTQVRRGAGQSIVASAAYRSGEKLLQDSLSILLAHLQQIIAG